MKEQHKKESPILSLLGMGGGGTGTALGGGVAAISASGGNITPAGIEPGNGYKYHVFTSPGNFVVGSGQGNVEYLVVGGGGGGGEGHGGGGGGGGVITNVSGNPRAGAAVEITPGTYAVVVGTGGPGDGPNSWPAPSLQGRGIDSTIAFPAAVLSQGGGQGGNQTIPRNYPSPRTGGSGGGGSSKGNPSTTGGYGGYGAGPPDNPAPTLQGYPGGQGYFHPGPTSNNPGGYTGGGGGGAGAAGQNASPGSGGAGDGGAGYPVPEFAAPLISPQIDSPNRSAWTSAVGPTGLYGGGGGGGGYGFAGPVTGAGGPGGGGGSAAAGVGGNPGTIYTGGGGSSTISPGAQNGSNLTEGSGATGIVAIRYAV